MVGASPFPRHWIYDTRGRLAAKTAVIDFRSWYRDPSPEHSPWGLEDRPAIVTAAETALERRMSALALASDPRFHRLSTSDTLTVQGMAGGTLFVLFDGIITVEEDEHLVRRAGPGSMLGEMALLNGGTRTATLRAATPCKIVPVSGDRYDRRTLEELASGRQTGAPVHAHS